MKRREPHVERHVDAVALEGKSFWTHVELAAYLGKSDRFVRDEILKHVPVVYLGDRTKLVERDDVFAFLRARKVDAATIF